MVLGVILCWNLLMFGLYSVFLFVLLLDSSRTVQKVVLITMAKIHQYLNNWSAFFHSSA